MFSRISEEHWFFRFSSKKKLWLDVAKFDKTRQSRSDDKQKESLADEEKWDGYY